MNGSESRANLMQKAMPKSKRMAEMMASRRGVMATNIGKVGLKRRGIKRMPRVFV